VADKVVAHRCMVVVEMVVIVTVSPLHTHLDQMEPVYTQDMQDMVVVEVEVARLAMVYRRVVMVDQAAQDLLKLLGKNNSRRIYIWHDMH
jgi:hypothetical protein